VLLSAHYLQPTGGNGEVTLSPSCTAGSVSNPSVVPLTAINGTTTVSSSGSNGLPSSCVPMRLQNCISLVGSNGSISPTVPSTGSLTQVVANGVPPNYPLYYPPPQFSPCYPATTTTRSVMTGFEEGVPVSTVTNGGVVNGDCNATA